MNNMSSFKNKTVILTGGSSGVGRAIALRFVDSHLHCGWTGQTHSALCQIYETALPGLGEWF